MRCNRKPIFSTRYKRAQVVNYRELNFSYIRISGEDGGDRSKVEVSKRSAGSAQIIVSLNNLLPKYIFKSFLTAVQLNICPCHLVLQLIVAR